MNNDQQRYLIRNPKAMMLYRYTGKLPNIDYSKGPLIETLRRIPPSMRCQIKGVRINETLGYVGERRFHTLEQAFQWLMPSCPSPNNISESWRIKRFTRAMTIDTIFSQCSNVPDWVRKALAQNIKT